MWQCYIEAYHFFKACSDPYWKQVVLLMNRVLFTKTVSVSLVTFTFCSSKHSNVCTNITRALVYSVHINVYVNSTNSWGLYGAIQSLSSFPASTIQHLHFLVRLSLKTDIKVVLIICHISQPTKPNAHAHNKHINTCSFYNVFQNSMKTQNIP